MDADDAMNRQRARFEAVRRRVFEEMQDAASRKRVSILLPFHVIVIAVILARGAAPGRIAIQIGAFVTCLIAMSVAEKTRGPRCRTAHAVTTAAVLLSIGNTGGLASPLLVSVVPFLIAGSMNPFLGNRRHALLGMFLVGFVVMASWTAAPIDLTRWLGAEIRWSMNDYIALSFVSAAVATLAAFKIGRAVGSAYERIALELAVRREELCDESEGRTRALEGIAARLAHEVKNPLAAIKGLSIHVARSATDEKVKERLTIVASEAERLQEIVEGFLSFSRGLDDLKVGPTKPYDIARELTLLLETRAADAGVALEVRGSRELTLNADGKKLRQALLNLVLNAMQASSRDATVTLEIATSCADGAAVLRVMDRGGGMTNDVLDRIQKPYFTTKEGGSGLGIAVARGIIEQHGGTLRFESASGRGTTATVTLPACALSATEKKTKLPGCRGFAAAMCDPLAAKKPEAAEAAARGGGAVGAVAAVSAGPEKVPS